MPPDSSESTDSGTSVDLGPIYVATGRVALAWAAFELHIDRVIWALAGIEPDPGACLTSQIASIHNRFRSLISLVKLRGADESLIKRLNQLSNESSKLVLKRNLVVHSTIGLHPSTLEILRTRISADKTLVFEPQTTSEKDTMKIRDEIAVHIERFLSFSDELAKLVPPPSR
jgi:hypothetical protein